MRGVGLALAFAVCACGSGAARADERELVLALQPAFSFAKTSGRMAWGGGGGIDLLYGVTDGLSVRITGAYGAHALPEVKASSANNMMGQPGGLVTAFHAAAGISYAIDIVRLVPYFDLAIGVLGSTLPPGVGKTTQPTYDFGVEVGIGADYLLTRRIALGFVVRYHAFATALTDIPIYLYAGPRLAIHWQL